MLKRSISRNTLKAPLPKKKVSDTQNQTRNGGGDYIPDESTVSILSLNRNSTVDAFTLRYLEAGLFATVLEDAIFSLNILDECNNDLRLISTNMDMAKLRALKYSVEQPPITDELAPFDPRRLQCDEYKIKKLEADRALLVKPMITTYSELALRLSYKPLWQFNNAFAANEHKMASILKDNERNRMVQKDLHRKLRVQRNKQNTLLYEMDSKLDDLHRLVEDAQLTSETTGRYIDNWQRARTEQHAYIITQKENETETIISSSKQRIEQEARVHSECDKLVQILIHETLNEVDYWMNTYETDIERIALATQVQKNDYRNMLDRRIYLEQTIDKHARQIREWIKFKEDRAAANKYSEEMTRCAIIVQAWWRGLLVRRELGPYKPARGKKGGKKKAK